MTGQRARHSDLLSTVAADTAAEVALRPRMLCATSMSLRASRAVVRASAIAGQLDAPLILLQITGAEPEDRASAVPAIATAAEDAGADLVVVDSWKSLQSMPAASSGELAARVRRPVLIVRSGSRMPYASVLIAVEQSTDFNRMLRTLSTWRLLESAPVAVMHGFESTYHGPLYTAAFDRQTARRNIEEWELAARRRLLRGVEPGMAGRFRHLFVQARPLREIRKDVRRLAPDLLVIATGLHAAVDRVMRASAGNDLLRNIDCDVLAMATEVS